MMNIEVERVLSTPKLEAVIQQNIFNTFVLNSKIRVSYTIVYIVPTHLFSTTHLEALIQQYNSNTFVLNSTFGGYYTIV